MQNIAGLEAIKPLETRIAGLGESSRVGAPTDVVGQTFKDTLANAMSAVNETMAASDKADASVVDGTAESLHSVQIAGVKSDILMKMTTTITSKLAQATTQLFQMQV